VGSGGKKEEELHAGTSKQKGRNKPLRKRRGVVKVLTKKKKRLCKEGKIRKAQLCFECVPSHEESPLMWRLF